MMALYVGLRAIAKRLKWKSHSTVLKYASLYSDPALNLPLIIRPLPNGKFTWLLDDIQLKDYYRAHRRQNLHAEKRLCIRKPRHSIRQCERCGDLVYADRWSEKGQKALRRILAKD